MNDPIAPWKIVYSQKTKHRDIPFIVDNNSDFVGKVYFHTGLNAEANAQLIAKAPELAEQNKKMLVELKKFQKLERGAGSPDHPTEDYEIVTNLIAEVEGLTNDMGRFK